MNHFIEIRSINLKPGRRDEFNRRHIEEVLPLLQRWNFDVVARGPSLHDENTYYVIRCFDRLAQREEMEDAYYASDDWRQGPRERILALIENRFARILSLNWMRTLCRGCGNRVSCPGHGVVNFRKILEVSMQALGIDVGGSGIKGAPIDVETGFLLAQRVRIKTPKKAEPEPVAQVVAQIAQSFNWNGPIGIGFPAPIKAGVALMAANISAKWVGTNADELFTRVTGCDCTLINDADAAGLAEMTFGAGRGQPGTVIMVTLGTGIGSAIFLRGKLLPNTEFGHLEMNGRDAEQRASDAARQRDELSWKKYAGRLNKYLAFMEKLFWPDLFIIGGGISKESEKYLPLLTIDTPVVPAQFLNEAGIVGAALAVKAKSNGETTG